MVAEALAPLAGARCLSIASGGDNTFSILARRPASVLAIDVNPAQLAVGFGVIAAVILLLTVLPLPAHWLCHMLFPP